MHTAKIARSIASDVCIYIIIYIIMCMYIYQIPVRMYGIYIYINIWIVCLTGITLERQDLSVGLHP